MKKIALLAILFSFGFSLNAQEFELVLPDSIWPGDRVEIGIRFEKPTTVHMTGACDGLPVYSIENYSRSGWSAIHKQLASDMGCDKSHLELEYLELEQVFQVDGRYRVCLDEVGCSRPFQVFAIPVKSPPNTTP